MDEQKRPRAWVYARIPGDYDGTMNSYKVWALYNSAGLQAAADQGISEIGSAARGAREQHPGGAAQSKGTIKAQSDFFAGQVTCGRIRSEGYVRS